MGEALSAPKCKLCGHCHWAREPHIFGKKPAAEPEQRRLSLGKKKAKKKPTKKRAKKCAKKARAKKKT